MINFIMEHITGDKFKSMAKVALEKGYNNTHVARLLTSSIVFIKTDYVEKALNALSKRQKPCALITHNSDIGIDYNTYKNKPEQVKIWYAQNVLHNATDLIPIPIGCENRKSPGYSGNMEVIDSILRKNIKREMSAYLNMNINTNHNEREPLVREFKDKTWVTYLQYGVPFEECMKQIKKHAFVFCPNGHGHDTHRYWESMYLGAIPIVKRSIHYEYFSDLPQLMVDKWEDVTTDLLNSTWEKYSKTKWNLDKLSIRYWKKRVLNWE